jgi:RNA polymerase sigma-54 factor
MCVRIIYSLDDNGYLTTRLEDLLDPTAGEPDRQLARAALATIQKLDPPGIGARDLRECLLLQLSPALPHYEELHALISDHLEDLHHNRMPVIQRKTGFTIELINDVLVELRKLNPKPGARFNDEQVPTVTPDVFLEPAEGGGYRVRLEDGNTPSLRISNYYRQRLLSGEATDEEKEFIRRKVNAAQWLIESIEQRRSTLTKVSQAIMDHQRAFLEKGPEHIMPLKMQQIADKVGVHVTTVSRAVDDKWVQTPRGIFSLRRFFVGGTTSADNEEVAWDAVRNKLKEIVDNEDKQKPFSDDELVTELAKHGLTVARRTVTKYRKAMNIPSSRERRDWTKALSTEKHESPNGASSEKPSPASTTDTVDDRLEPATPERVRRVFG